MYDVIIRNGTVVDGSAMPRFRADVGIVGRRIVAVGRLRERGRREIDADGHVVTPGFIDGHTHMDAQVMWDPLATPQCWHGITTVVMGNCGFTIAPVRPGEERMIVQNLERAEAIPAAALAAGIEWSWETFPQYLDAVERIPKGINFAGYVGHSALRTWAMGERAFEELASDEDLELMARQLRDGLAAGAVGFTTSRSGAHETAADRPVASRVAAWDEVRCLAGVAGEQPGTVIELATGGTFANEGDSPVSMAELERLAVESGATVTFGVMADSRPGRERYWRELLALIDSAAPAGGRMFGQTHSKLSGVLISFGTQLPFDKLEGWTELRSRPLEAQRRALRDPDVRRELVAAAAAGSYARAIGAEVRPPDYDRIQVLDDVDGRNPSIAEIAAARRQDPVEVMIDLALDNDLERFFFQALLNLDYDDCLEILRHPRCVMTFSDAGAHVIQLVDSIQTALLAYWVRERGEFSLEEAVRMLTLVPSTVWGFADRGLVREGYVADLNVFDPQTIGSEPPQVVSDLPGGARRLVQRSRGFLATVVGGQVAIENGAHTEARGGELIRRRAPA